ncbi:hypothetical protein IDG52_02695, partial [Pelagibacterales bacterium SAG-MED23]|nr:hypothetical protein [Pelagibacterales bacterium SAG-MED23]
MIASIATAVLPVCLSPIFNFNVNEFKNFVNKKYSQFSVIESDVNYFVDKSLENFFNI